MKMAEGVGNRRVATVGEDISDALCVRWHERVGVLHHGCGIPLDWAEGLSWIYVMPSPRDMWPDRWRRAVGAIALMVDGFGDQLFASPWTPADFLGVRTYGDVLKPAAPIWKMDHLLILGVGASGEIEAESSGVRLRFVPPQ